MRTVKKTRAKEYHSLPMSIYLCIYMCRNFHFPRFDAMRVGAGIQTQSCMYTDGLTLISRMGQSHHQYHIQITDTILCKYSYSACIFSVLFLNWSASCFFLYSFKCNFRHWLLCPFKFIPQTLSIHNTHGSSLY